MSKAKMVMPPVFRFHFPENSTASTWGWYRAIDLVEVVNNIRILRGQRGLTAGEIGREYPDVNPNVFAVVMEPVYANENARLGSLSSAPHKWLECGNFYRRCFLPAKIGMLLLKVVKDPSRATCTRVRITMRRLSF
ncbi:hypothetical protein HY415_00415 [Candidatus Kaiserbacteria bacterium]|nr:hypothetical protein [Candidatus Kaiserbacteria bacterium]